MRFFAASLLCHATTYAALALAITPMEGAVISAAMESVRQAQQQDLNSMRSNTFLVEYDNNVGYCQNKAGAIKTGGDNAVHRNAQIQQDERGNFGTTDRSDSFSATSMEWCNSSNTCCSLQRTGDGEYDGGERAMAKLRASGQRGSMRKASGGDTARSAANRDRTHMPAHMPALCAHRPRAQRCCEVGVHGDDRGERRVWDRDAAKLRTESSDAAR